MRRPELSLGMRRVQPKAQAVQVGADQVVQAAHKDHDRPGRRLFAAQQLGHRLLDQAVISGDNVLPRDGQIADPILKAVLQRAQRPVPAAGGRADEQQVHLGNQRRDAHDAPVAMTGRGIAQRVFKAAHAFSFPPQMARIFSARRR